MFSVTFFLFILFSLPFSLFSSLRDTFCCHLPRELKLKSLKIKSPTTDNTKQNNKTRQRSRQGHFQNYVTLMSASNSRLIQGSTSPWLMYPTSCVPHTFEKVEKTFQKNYWKCFRKSAWATPTHKSDQRAKIILHPCMVHDDFYELGFCKLMLCKIKQLCIVKCP